MRRYGKSCLMRTIAQGLKYLFVDEAQNVKGYGEGIEAFRTDGCWSVFITDSNSCLLSGELTTKLTGHSNLPLVRFVRREGALVHARGPE